MSNAREPIDWHWPRSALADHYMRMFLSVGAHSMVLFAPRGKGKTQFMTHDILPVAHEAGLLPVYVNFWDDRDNPATSMRYALLRTAEEAGYLQKMRDAMSRTKAEITFGVHLGPVKIDAKPVIEKKQSEDSILFNLRQITDSLAKHSGKKLLFIFDEVQTLALKPEHETFVRSLRTLLDERRGTVYSIFTGSSQYRLTELFSRIKAPLYSFAQLQEFPSLGDDFLKRWMGNIQAIMGGAQSLRIEEMREAFVLTDRNPRIFWASVMDMIQSNSIDIVSHTKKIVQNTGEMSGMRQRVAELSALDKSVLQEIVAFTIASRQSASGTSSEKLEIFSAASRERIGRGPGMTPTPSQVQGALKRLMENDNQLIVTKGRGEYEIEDPFFLQWYQEELLGIGDAIPEKVEMAENYIGYREAA